MTVKYTRELAKFLDHKVVNYESTMFNKGLQQFRIIELCPDLFVLRDSKNCQVDGAKDVSQLLTFIEWHDKNFWKRIKEEFPEMFI